MKKKKVRADMRIIPVEFFYGNEILKWKKKFDSKMGKEGSKKGFG